MIKLSKYLYKNVKIKTIDGKVYKGFVGMHCDADENDDGVASIGILLNRNAKSGTELSQNEIETIEII